MPGVLIVEDEVLVRLVLRELLEEAGFAVFEADDAAEALGILNARAAEIHVLLADVRLPGTMDGVTLAKTVEETRPCVRAIITSGTPEYAHRALPANAKFLLKPWAAETLLEYMHELTGEPLAKEQPAWVAAA